MLKAIIRKFAIYRKKKLRKNIFRKKITHKLNPFTYTNNSSEIVENLIVLMNKTPEEEAATMQRVMNMLKLMAHPYKEEKINDMVKKFTNITKEEDYYYEVHAVKMNQNEYQKYLDKKALNEKLHKKLDVRKKEKRVKL